MMATSPYTTGSASVENVRDAGCVPKLTSTKIFLLGGGVCAAAPATVPRIAAVISSTRFGVLFIELLFVSPVVVLSGMAARMGSRDRQMVARDRAAFATHHGRILMCPSA